MGFSWLRDSKSGGDVEGSMGSSPSASSAFGTGASFGNTLGGSTLGGSSLGASTLGGTALGAGGAFASWNVPPRQVGGDNVAGLGSRGFSMSSPRLSEL